MLRTRLEFCEAAVSMIAKLYQVETMENVLVPKRSVKKGAVWPLEFSRQTELVLLQSLCNSQFQFPRNSS